MHSNILRSTSLLFVLISTLCSPALAQEVTQSVRIDRQLGDPPTRVTFDPFDDSLGELMAVTLGFEGLLDLEVLIQNFSTLELEADDWFYDVGANIILAFDQKPGYDDGGPFFGLGGIFQTGVTGALSAGSGGPIFVNPTPGDVDVTFSFSGDINSQIRTEGNLDYFITDDPIMGQTQPFQDYILTPPLNGGPDDFIDASALQLFQEGTLSMTYEYAPRLGRPEDCNGDGQLNADDLSCVCSSGAADVGDVLQSLGLVRGDLDGDGEVNFLDFLTLAQAFNTEADYSSGDVDCSGTVDFQDFLAVANNFGKSASEVANVPAPSSISMLAMLLCICLPATRPKR